MYSIKQPMLQHTKPEQLSKTENAIAYLDSCLIPENEHDFIAEKVSEAIALIIKKENELVRQGVTGGCIASYPRDGKTYYNLVVGNKRLYLRKALLGETKAAIARNQQVKHLKEQRELLERVLFNLRRA